MGLNIKNERVHELARILAQSTGKNMTAVIEDALREKLERLERAKEKEAVIARVKRIVRESGPTAPGISSDHSDLYDEDGLPA
ncbi:MAG TPA: type II toxin-antitoxin system VapB family antitoxin [Propylenella sp.]